MLATVYQMESLVWNYGHVFVEYQYLRGVEVSRPGRTTLDMKMEELKRKMDAHIAEQNAASVKQVPPVTVEAPDLEEIRQTMAAGSEDNLSKLAAGTVKI